MERQQGCVDDYTMEELVFTIMTGKVGDWIVTTISQTNLMYVKNQGKLYVNNTKLLFDTMIESLDTKSIWY